MKRTAALLTVTTLLLAACQPQPTPLDSSTPVVGQSLDMQDLPTKASSAFQELGQLTSPSNPDMDPDLKALLGIVGPTSLSQLSLDQPTKVGQQILANLTGEAKLRSQSLGTLTVESRDYPLPTGTIHYDVNGMRTDSPTPTDGYVEINDQTGTRIDVQWQVGGAQTIWVTRGEEYDFERDAYVPVRVELPTGASVTLTKGGQVRAGATFSMTPGECLERTGPDALKFNAWAGRQTNAPVSLNLDYGWGAQGLKLNAAARYATTQQAASVNLNLALDGTTAGRCTDTPSFTPSGVTLTADLTLPNHKFAAGVSLRDVKNIVISGEELQKENFFQNVAGNLQAFVAYNGKNMFTARGSIADGSDLDLNPGDQVRVRYIMDGHLVMQNLPEAQQSLTTQVFSPNSLLVQQTLPATQQTLTNLLFR